MSEEVTGAIRGTVPASPRWLPVRDLNNDGATLLNRGRAREGRAKLERAIALTRVPDPDGEAFDLRSRALANLAAARELGGDLDGALNTIDEALAAGGEARRLLGEERGTRAVVTNAHLARAQTLIQLDRLDEALACTDRAVELHAERAASEHGPSDGVIEFSIHNVRCGIHITAGRWPDAQTEAEQALQVALATDPTMAAYVYTNLAVIAQHTGDEAAAGEYVQLSEEIHETSTDAASRQLAAENRARVAFRQERYDDAIAGFEAAERLAHEAELPDRATAARAGIAGVWMRRGRPGRAAKVLRAGLARLPQDGAHQARFEAWSMIGDAYSYRARYAAAEQSYLEARECARTVHDRCRVDVRRAEMHAEWAAVTPGPGTRVARLERARDLAVTALLATEALRDGFPPGPVRERWAGLVCAPARELAFTLATTLADPALLRDLVENATSSATLTTAAAASDGAATSGAVGETSLSAWRDEVDAASLRDASAAEGPTTEDLPLAAGVTSGSVEETGTGARGTVAQGEAAHGVQRHDAATAGTGAASSAAPNVTASVPLDVAASGSAEEALPAAAGGILSPFADLSDVVRFALPPRVRPAPGAPVALAEWIDRAEAEYGIPVRSSEVVAGW